jgi:hypothetical protein
MRIPVVCTVAALGLLGCRHKTVYLNADDAASLRSAPPSTPCNDLEQQGREVDLAGSHDAASTPAGGTIEDGTYVLTSSTLYTNDRRDGAKLVGMGKVTMLVNGSTSQIVRSSPEGRERRTTVNRVSSGDVTTLHTTCAPPGSTGADATSSARYTATSSSFQFISVSPAGTIVTTYTKVPTSLAASTVGGALVAPGGPAGSDRRE